VSFTGPGGVLDARRAEQAGTHFSFWVYSAAMRLIAPLAVLLSVGCSGGGVLRTVTRPPSPLGLTAVVVYPVQVLGEAAPAWRTYELGERLTAAVVGAGGDRLAILGPTEFRVLRWEDDAPWVASDALPALVRLGLKGEQAVVLKARLERRVGSLRQEARDPRGLARAASSTDDTRWVVRLELLHPASHTTLVELSGEVEVDPFAPPSPEDEYDPTPGGTRLLEQLAREAVQAALANAQPGTLELHPLTRLAQTPAGAAALPDPQVARMDPLSVELWLQGRARYLNPGLSDRDTAAVARLGPGLYVLEAPRHARIRAGDLIVSIEGQAPLRQVLARRRLAGGHVPVRVRRAGVEVDASVP
jgi:hypothetical protein